MSMARIGFLVAASMVTRSGSGPVQKKASALPSFIASPAAAPRSGIPGILSQTPRGRKTPSALMAEPREISSARAAAKTALCKREIFFVSAIDLSSSLVSWFKVNSSSFKDGTGWLFIHRFFQKFLYLFKKTRRNHTVGNAVVGRKSHGHHGPDRDGAIMGNRARGYLADGQDSTLGRI